MWKDRKGDNMSDEHKKMELVFARTRYDGDFSERIRKTTLEIEKDKKNLLNRSKDYDGKYKEEILEGTRKRQLLLGRAGNPTDPGEQARILADHGKFLPTKYTPILNMLYFMLREEEGPNWMSIKREYDERYGGIQEDINLDREQLESKYGGLMHDEEKFEDVKEPEEMDSFIYGNMSHDTYRKIKKLKRLSRSSNQNEAFLAYRMCLQLCERYNLEFDKINVD